MVKKKSSPKGATSTPAKGRDENRHVCNSGEHDDVAVVTSKKFVPSTMGIVEERNLSEG